MLKVLVVAKGLKNLEILGVECDVASEASVKAAYETVIEKFGRIDSVVASAGMLNSFSARSQ